ncbi:MAG: hypothetical protein QM296_06335, partial [Bacillota bacterium]|nr:hypothetical protein [Bacillota bacterium]
KHRYCPISGAIPRFLSTPWSKTSILPDSRGNTVIFVHSLVKNFVIARFQGQYRDFCPPPLYKFFDIARFRGNIGFFVHSFQAPQQMPPVQLLPIDSFAAAYERDERKSGGADHHLEQ